MPRHVTELDLANFLSDSTTSSTTTWSSSKIVAYVAAEIGDIAVIDDGTIVGDKTWSSNKINTTVTTAVAGRIPVITSPNINNFPIITAGGNLATSSFNSGSFATVSHNHNVLNLTGFPTVSGQNGRFLSNDGSALLWAALTKASVGLSNVDNTSDAAKPISTAVATALAGKEDRSNFYQSVSQAINWDNGRRQRMDAGSNLALTFTGGQDGDFLFLEITAIGGADRLVTLPTGVWGAFTYNRFLVPSGKSVAISGYKSGSVFKLFPGAEAGLLT